MRGGLGPYTRTAGKKSEEKADEIDESRSRRKLLRTETDETVRIVWLMKQNMRRDERVKIRGTSSFKTVKERIDFYPVQKIVKRQREVIKSRHFYFLNMIFSTLRCMQFAMLLLTYTLIHVYTCINTDKYWFIYI